MPRAAALLATLLACLALPACGKESAVTADDAPNEPAAAQTATTPSAQGATTSTPEAIPATPDAPARSARDGCRTVPAATPQNVPDRRAPRKRLSADRVHSVVMQTNCGTITIRLSAINWPKTTASFAGLVRARFFDGLSFHRIAKPGGNDYVIQGGDPLGSGNGGPGYDVYETPPSTTTYPRYTVAMAKAQDERAGTSGSQFFIVTAEVAPLDPDYAVLGRVTGGEDVVRRIARLAADPATEMPIDPVVISTARLRSAARDE